ASAVASRVDAARVRILARQTEIALVVLLGDVKRRIDARHRPPADRGELLVALWQARERLVERRLFPAIAIRAQVVQLFRIKHHRKSSLVGSFEDDFTKYGANGHLVSLKK